MNQFTESVKGQPNLITHNNRLNPTKITNPILSYQPPHPSPPSFQHDQATLRPPEMSTPVRIPKSSPSPISKANNNKHHSPSRTSSSHSSPKSSSSGTSSKSSSPRRHSRPELMSSSLKSQDDYLVYEIPSGDPENGLGSVVIIPKSSQGFSWNEDVFLSKYHLNNLASPKRLSQSGESVDDNGSRRGESSDDGRDEDFVDVHRIHIEDDDREPWWEDLA